MNIIKANSRGKTKIKWLNSRHSFSFGNYYSSRNGFGALRVLNDDVIAPHSGFDTHPHSNMEIITIMLDGELTHTDSIGHSEKLIPGEIQVMSAGSGIMHSEYNNSSSPVHLLQLWIQTKDKDIEPRYNQKKFEFKKNSMTEIVSGQNAPLYIHQDAVLTIAKYDAGNEFSYILSNARGVYLFVIKGTIVVNNQKLSENDAAELKESFTAVVKDECEVLIIDVEI